MAEHRQASGGRETPQGELRPELVEDEGPRSPAAEEPGGAGGGEAKLSPREEEELDPRIQVRAGLYCGRMGSEAWASVPGGKGSSTGWAGGGQGQAEVLKAGPVGCRGCLSVCILGVGCGGLWAAGVPRAPLAAELYEVAPASGEGSKTVRASFWRGCVFGDAEPCLAPCPRPSGFPFVLGLPGSLSPSVRICCPRGDRPWLGIGQPSRAGIAGARLQRGSPAQLPCHAWCGQCCGLCRPSFSICLPGDEAACAWSTLHGQACTSLFSVGFLFQ